MRKDFCYFAQCDEKTLFNAYLQAIQTLFDTHATLSPYYRIKFDLGFSFKYNMNGGACTLHIMPVNGGSAVNIRYSIVQLCGARCGTHAKNLTEEASRILGFSPTECNINVKDFVAYADRITAFGTQNSSNAFTSSNCTPDTKITCPKCKAIILGNSKFCTNCGVKTAPITQKCTECGTEVPVGSNFCNECGARINTSPKFCTGCGAAVDSSSKFCTSCGQNLQ